MASCKIFTRVCIGLMLYLASTPSLAQSESKHQMNSGTINTTYRGSPNLSSTDPRNPPFLSNVFRGLDIANGIVGYQMPLIEIVTGIASGRASSSVGDFTSIQLFFFIASTAEIACLSSKQPWGEWETTFSYREPVSSGQHREIPIYRLRNYDQRRAFGAVPTSYGPWLIVFLRVGIVANRPVLIWFFGNPERDRCALVIRNNDDTWYFYVEPISTCRSYGLPANVSVPLTFLLDDANTTFSSSSSNLPPSTTGIEATQVASPMQKLDGLNQTDGDYQLVATS